MHPQTIIPAPAQASSTLRQQCTKHEFKCTAFPAHVSFQHNNAQNTDLNAETSFRICQLKTKNQLLRNWLLCAPSRTGKTGSASSSAQALVVSFTCYACKDLIFLLLALLRIPGALTFELYYLASPQHHCCTTLRLCYGYATRGSSAASKMKLCTISRASPRCEAVTRFLWLGKGSFFC